MGCCAALQVGKPVTTSAQPIGIGRGIGSELKQFGEGLGVPMFSRRLSQGISARSGYDDEIVDRRGGSWVIRSPFTPDDYD